MTCAFMATTVRQCTCSCRHITHLNAEVLSNLLGSFAPDLLRDSLACDVQQTLDIQVVRCKNQFKKLSVVCRQELFIKGFDLHSTE